MKAGDLCHRVTLQSRTEGRDSMGGIDYSWQNFATIWAAIEPARAFRTFGAAQEQEAFDTLIRIRYLSGVRSTMRVLWEPPDSGSPTVPKTYEIVGVRTRDERRTEMFLQCIERQADGWRKG